MAGFEFDVRRHVPDGVSDPDAPVAGVPAEQPVTHENVAEQVGTIAARMRAAAARARDRTKNFPVPPVDVWGDDLVLVAQDCDLEQGMTGLALVAAMTRDVLARDPRTGDMVPVADVPEAHGQSGWAGVGRIMGVVTDANADAISAGAIILACCGTPQIVAAWSDGLVAWLVGRRGTIERVLGE